LASEKKFINEKMNRVLLKEYLKDKTDRAGFGGCEVSRTPMGTRITLHIERPALVIGRKGRNIRKLTSDVQEKFNFDNPQIEVQEVNVPELNPQIMASKLANSLERGWHFRRAGHSTVRRILQSGARGCQIILSGKITGPRHRVEKFVDGHIKHCGEEEKKWMHEGFATAKVKLGVIGVTVQIMDPNARLPDEIDVSAPKLDDKSKEEKDSPVDQVKDPEKEKQPEEEKSKERVEPKVEKAEKKDSKKEDPKEKVEPKVKKAEVKKAEEKDSKKEDPKEKVEPKVKKAEKKDSKKEDPKEKVEPKVKKGEEKDSKKEDPKEKVEPKVKKAEKEDSKKEDPKERVEPKVKKAEKEDSKKEDPKERVEPKVKKAEKKDSKKEDPKEKVEPEVEKADEEDDENEVKDDASA